MLACFDIPTLPGRVNPTQWMFCANSTKKCSVLCVPTKRLATKKAETRLPYNEFSFIEDIYYPTESRSTYYIKPSVRQQVEIISGVGDSAIRRGTLPVSNKRRG